MSYIKPVFYLSIFLVYSFEKDQILTHLDPTTSYEHFKKCDIIVEAVFEDLKVKHKVVKEVEAVSSSCHIFLNFGSKALLRSVWECVFNFAIYRRLRF